MKRLWASWIIVTMMLSIFSLSFKPILRAESKNRQAMNIAIKFNLIGEDEQGNPMESWRQVPWQNTPDMTWWGREGFRMPNAQRAKHPIIFTRSIPATTQNGFYTTPVMWGRFFMDIIADGGMSRGRDVWYFILDDAGQVWFDPDGIFHDPRYEETADPGFPGEGLGGILFPTEVYVAGSCQNNPLVRIDPIPGNNSQGPYIFDPFYRFADARDQRPTYQPNIFFWDNRPGIGTKRTWKLGWANFTDFENNTSVQSSDWDTDLLLVPFRSDEYFVDLAQTFKEVSTSPGRYDYGEFIYRKGLANPNLWVEVGDIRLTPVVSYDPATHRNVTYEPNSYVASQDLDFLAGYELNAFGPDIMHANIGPNPGFYFHESFIYQKILPNVANEVQPGDLRLTPVNKIHPLHGFLSRKGEWWGGISKHDALIMTEILEGGCHAPTYDIHVQSDLWMGIQPSVTSVRLRSPSNSIHLPAQHLQKSTTMVPDNGKYPLPVTTFHGIRFTQTEFAGMEIWKDDGTNNKFLTSLNNSKNPHKHNMSDDYVEGEVSEHYIGSDNLSFDLDYGRRLQRFSPDIRFYDASGTGFFGSGDALYKKDRDNADFDRVEAGDLRFSDMKFDVMGQRFEYRKNTFVRSGDPDLGFQLSAIPPIALYYPLSRHAFAGLEELMEYEPGDDIYTKSPPVYAETVNIRALGDAWQYLYADVDNSLTVTPGDIRIFSVNTQYADGSIVRSGDADVGMMFNPLPGHPTETALHVGTDAGNIFAYANVTRITDPLTINPGDVRLTNFMNFRPGSVISPTDPDANQPFAMYDVYRTQDNELFIDVSNNGLYAPEDIALTPLILRSGMFRLTNIKISDKEYPHGTRVSAGNVYYHRTPLHMIPMKHNGDIRFADMAIIPAKLGLIVNLSNELTVERTTQIEIQVNPPPKLGEKIYIYVYEPDLQETSIGLVISGILTTSFPRLTFQYNPWKGSVGYSGQALERYFRVEAFKVYDSAPMGQETSSGKSSITKPFTGIYADPFWATQKVVRGPIHFDAQRSANTPFSLPRIRMHHPHYQAFYDGYECFEEWKDIILPAKLHLLPNKKTLTVYEERQPVMEIQVFDGDDPLDVNDPSGIPFSTSTDIDENVPLAYYNVHGAGIAYLFVTYLSNIRDALSDYDDRRQLEGWEKGIVQVNTDNSFQVWQWFDIGYTDRFDGSDSVAYFGRGINGNFQDQDCSIGSGLYDLDTGSTQKPPPLGDNTQMDTFAGSPIIHYGVPVKLTNFQETDIGGRFLVVAKPRDSATLMNVVFYSHQMMYDYNLGLAYPRYGGHMYYGPYFTTDLSNGIDYIGSVQIKVCDPDPILNFTDITWVDHALQYSRLNYTAGSGALSPMMSPPAPYIRARYNPVLYDWHDDIRSYPGGQTHTGRVVGNTGTGDTGRGSGWNAYPAIWSKNTARIHHGVNYDTTMESKYNQFNKLGTEFYPFTDYSMYFFLKNFYNLNYTFESSPPNLISLIQNGLLLSRITIKGPFMRPRQFYDLQDNTISYTLPNQFGDLAKVPIQYDYSGEITITNQNYQLYEFALGTANFTNITSPPTSEIFISSETTIYDQDNPVIYPPGVANPLLEYNGALDYSRAFLEQGSYNNPINTVFAINEIIPIGRGRITIEVELANGVVKTFEDCCTGDFKEGGFLVHGLEIETSQKTFEPDMDHKLEVRLLEYEPKGYDPRYTETVNECNNAVMVVWQDRGIKDASGRIIGAGDGWMTRPPVSSVTTDNAYQFNREHDINGDGKVSFADYETEILGTYDLATNTWTGGLIDARTYSRNNGLYVMDLSQSNGNQVTTVGYDFGGGARIGEYTNLDHIVDMNEMLPIVVTAYKYGDDNNDRAFSPFYDYFEPAQYSHEVYLSGQTIIDVVPSQSLNITTSPEVLTAGTQAELNDPQSPFTLIVLDEEGNPVDLSKGGIKDASGYDYIRDEDIWTNLILDPHPDNRYFYGADARLPQYYWLRTDLHNVDNSFVNNRLLYSSASNPFYPIEIDFRDRENGRYIFNGFVANDEGSFEVFIFTPDRKKFGKTSVKVALPQVTYEVVNVDDPRGQVFTSPGDPDFVLTAGDNRLYRITAQARSAHGVPLRGAGSDISVCGGTANETARFTLLSSTPNNFGWRLPLLAGWGNASRIENRTYQMIRGKNSGTSALSYIRAGFDYNQNGVLDELNQEIFNLGGFHAYRYNHLISIGTKYEYFQGNFYTYYNTKSWMWDNGEFATYPLHFIVPDGVLKKYEAMVYPAISFERGMGLGAIYNSPHKGGYTIADLDGDGHLTYHDSFNLDREGKTSFYLYAEDIASIGGLIGNNRYSIHDVFSDVAGNSAAYTSGRDPQRLENRLFNTYDFRSILLPCIYQWICDPPYNYEWYCDWCENTWPTLPQAWIRQSTFESTADNTFRLDWDALPGNYLELKAPSVDLYDAHTNVALGKDLLSSDAYDIAFGKTNHILIRAYPADRRDLPLQTGSSMMMSGEEFFPNNPVYIYGPQAETAVFGNLYECEADPRARETMLSFTPTGTGKRQIFLQYWNYNTRFTYPPAYMVGGSAAFDVAQGLEIEIFENEPLKARTPGRITVVVTEAGTQRPVRGARITIEGLGVSDSKTADSGGKAEFSLTPNNRGVLVVRASMEGMITATRLKGVDEDVEPQFIDLDPVDVLHDTQMVIISGRVKVGSVVTVNDHPAPVDEQGRFRFEARMEKQNNFFEIVARDPSGKIARRVVNIERQTDELEIQMNVEEKYIEAQEVSIRGKVLRTKLTEETPSRLIWIFVNGIEAQVVPDDRHIEFTFEATVPLEYGRNRIEVNVRTAEGFAKKSMEVNNYRKASIELQINNDRALINGEQKIIDAAPYISSGRTFVPLRVVAEGFGAEVTWVQQTRGINITLGDQVISMQIGSNRAMVNNEMVHMDAPPEIKNGRTFVPIRFVSEMLGAEVEWVQATRTVKIVRLILD